MLRCCWKVFFRSQPFQQRHFSTLPLSKQQQQGNTSVRVGVKELEREREGERLHKVIANTGLCSRRQAELLIKKKRVFVNGKPASTVSFVTAEDVITIDGNKLNNEETKLWMHNKKSGVLVTTNNKEDYKGRRVLFREFERMYVPPSAHIAVDPLKYNAEGCMLLTNNGALAQYLESPAAGFERRHKLLVYGNLTEEKQRALERGFKVDSVHYPPVNPRIVSDTLDKQTWIEISLFAKLNIKEMFAGLCLKVSRNIRTSFGPYSIRKLESGAVMEVPLNDELKQFLSLHNKSKWIHAAAPHTSDETALSHIQ